ncbi:MAG: 6-phosphogluconate dehydrogenase [Mycobacterium sp.]|nr:6-phosphogluconate dehydrogenase [Mycobacterium sp.]
MTHLTVIGLGPMGQALSSALLDANVSLSVWNRTESKANGLLARGAEWAPSPAAAVAASDLTLINVVDHAALDAVVDSAGEAVAGRTIVGLSSDAPERARRTAALVEKLGGRYLDGAIMTPTVTIGTPDASILFAGPRDLYDAHHSTFATLATPTWVGDEVGRAAGFDMALLDLFWTSVGGFMHALKVAGANGIGPAELLPHAHGIVGILPPILDEIAERVGADRHGDSDASVSSLGSSLRHLIDASRDAGADTAALEALRRSADAAVAAGQGDDEVSRVTSYL